MKMQISLHSTQVQPMLSWIVHFLHYIAMYISNENIFSDVKEDFFTRWESSEMESPETLQPLGCLYLIP